METLLLLFSLIPFYFLGAFPTGFLIAKTQGVDIGAVGSGNVGATNVARSVGKRAGLYTLLGDVLKGGLSVLIASMISDQLSYQCLAGLAAVAGHCFSIPGKLKGGKGVATALGVILALHPAIALVTIFVFIAVLLIWRMVSLASVLAALSAPTIAILTDVAEPISMTLAALALLITARHHANLHRIASGKEPKLGNEKAPAKSPSH